MHLCSLLKNEGGCIQQQLNFLFPSECSENCSELCSFVRGEKWPLNCACFHEELDRNKSALCTGSTQPQDMAGPESPGPWTLHRSSPHHLISSGLHTLCRQLPWDPQPPLETNCDNIHILVGSFACTSSGLVNGARAENYLELQPMRLESQGVSPNHGRQPFALGWRIRNQELRGHRDLAPTLPLPSMETLPQ